MRFRQKTLLQKIIRTSRTKTLIHNRHYCTGRLGSGSKPYRGLNPAAKKRSTLFLLMKAILYVRALDGPAGAGAACGQYRDFAIPRKAACR
jgi:hypothetical protein